MGLPIFDIKFQTKAIEAIGLATRGFVALCIKDATQTAGTYTYKNFAEVLAGSYDTSNYDLIEAIFKGSPTKVKVISGAPTAVFSDIQASILQNSPDIDYITAPDYTADNTAIISFITDKRTNAGAKLKGVLVATGSDLEYIIDVKVTGAVDDTATALPNQEARIAGIVAGLDPTRSSTYFVVPEVNNVDFFADPDLEINNGHLIYINDGAKVKIARGVNSFVSTTPTKGALFSKIKNVETMDMIAYSIREVVQDDYVGKFTNSLDNKNLIVTAVNQFLRVLADANYLNPSFDNKCTLDLQAHLDYAELNGEDTTGYNETQIKKIDTGDNLYLIVNCRLLDTIEDVTINVYI